MQQGLNWVDLEAFDATLTQTSLANGLPAGYAMNQFQWSIAESNPEHAGLLDIFQYINPEARTFIKDSFDARGTSNPKLEDRISGELKTYHSQIVDAANRHLPGTIQNTAQKGWHIALIKQALRTMVYEGAETPSKYKDVMTALPEAMRRLYGYWGKTFTTDGPVRVALPYKLTNGSNVDQDNWEESLHYTYARARYLWGPDLALVAREGIAKGVLGLYPSEQNEFKKGIELNIEGQGDPRFLGTNQYNPDWNVLKRHFIENGAGNIWVGRINDPDEPSRIRLVIMAGNIDYPTDVQIVGDLYRTDENGKAIPVSFSAEEMVQMMASRQAWQLMDSDDDSWDWIDGWTLAARAMSAVILGDDDKLNLSTGLARNRWTERGGDFGRENIDYYHNKYSKDVADSDYHKLEANAIGGKYLTEWSDPGRVEMDMYIDPLWEQIQILEKSESEKKGKPYTITEDEFIQLFALVKSRLNGTRGWFFDYEAETPMTYFDSFFSNEPQDWLERLRQRRFKLQSIFEAMHD